MRAGEVLAIWLHDAGAKMFLGIQGPLAMVQRYAHLAPSHLQAAVERLVARGAVELARN